MRTLCVLSAPPFPLDHALRIPNRQYLEALTELGEVTLLTWQPPGSTDGDLEAVRALVPDTVVLPWRGRRADLAARLERRLRFVAGGLPHYVQAMLEERGLRAGPTAAVVDEAVRARHARTPFDLVVLGEEAMACVPLPDLGAPTVLHRWNGFVRMVAAIDRHRRWRRPLVPVEARAWKRFEQTVSAAADLVIAPTSGVAAETRRHAAPSTAVAVIANGVDPAPPSPPPSAGADVAFIGAMDYPANVDAVQWFVGSCWPTVRHLHPRSSLRIVGRDPAPAVRALEGDGVVVTGTVDDVVAACAGSRVGVVPLRGGMGIKNKTLELMAMGLPVVSTPEGAEGIAAEPRDGLLVRSEPAGIVAALSRLLAAPGEADRLGAAAHAYVTTHHSWPQARADYRQLIGGLLEPSSVTA